MTMSNPLYFDATLALMLVIVAWGALLVRDLFQAIVLFTVFGLLLAVAWCRLDAVDVALAEAAIGAGLTGALLVNTLASRRRDQQSPTGGWESCLPRRMRPAFVAFTLAVAGALATVIVPLALAQDAPRVPVHEAPEFVGVTNPTTAVLLGFRAWDTFLEVAVLLTAVLAALPAMAAGPVARESSGGPVLVAFVRLMVPVAFILGAYLLWVGTKSSGGAFQAAAVLAAGGVLLSVSGTRSPTFASRWQRLPLVFGLAVFLFVALGGWGGGGRFLEYPPGWAVWLILLIESALTVSITLILITLFAATSANRNEPS
jgi:uncharacterized MnhB-related membrane protein